MLINTEVYNRYLLPEESKAFFKKLVPLSFIVSQWTYDKGLFLNIDTPRGVLPSILLADILIKSDYGRHPVAREDCLNKYSNNLALLESDRYWSGKTNTYEDRVYRAYKTWRNFAEDYSDYWTFSRRFDKVLESDNFIDQARALSLAHDPTICYDKKILNIVSSLGLSEYDQSQRQV